MLCDFGLVDNIVNQIADIALSAMEARNFLISGMFVQQKLEFGELETSHQ